jgi:hypothetical protein
MKNELHRRTPVPRVISKPRAVPRTPGQKKKKFPLTAILQLAILGFAILFLMLYHPEPIQIHASQIQCHVTQAGTLYCDLPGSFPQAPTLCGIFTVSETLEISAQSATSQQSAAQTRFFIIDLPPEPTEILIWIPFALYDHTLVLGEAIQPDNPEIMNPPSPVPVTATPHETPFTQETGTASSQTPTATGTPTIRPTAVPTARSTATPAPIPSTAVPGPTATTLAATAPTSSVFALYPADTRYLFQQLTDPQRQIFSRIYDGVAAFLTSIHLDIDCSETDLQRVMHVLLTDCPELFQISDSYLYRSSSLSQVTDVTPSYQMTEKTYQETLNQTLAEIDALRELPDFGTGAYENELAIYRQIRSVCVYDNEKPFSECAFSPFLNGYAKCDGYSRALMLALRFYAIPCFMVSGDATDPDDPTAPAPHSWNYVKIEKQWYQCDSTWDDASVAAADSALAGYLPYLNITDVKMSQSRTIDPEDSSWVLPVCTSTDANYYVRRGNVLPAGTDLNDEILTLLTGAYQRKETVIPILFTTEAAYTRMKEQQSAILRQWQSGSAYIQRWNYLYVDSIWLFYFYDIRYSTQ